VGFFAMLAMMVLRKIAEKVLYSKKKNESPTNTTT